MVRAPAEGWNVPGLDERYLGTGTKGSGRKQRTMLSNLGPLKDVQQRRVAGVSQRDTLRSTRYLCTYM